MQTPYKIRNGNVEQFVLELVEDKQYTISKKQTVVGGP